MLITECRDFAKKYLNVFNTPFSKDWLLGKEASTGQNHENYVDLVFKII